MIEPVKPSSNPLVKHLSQDGVLTSSELIALLTAEGASPANARAMLKRHSANDEIWRSGDLRLARNERLFTLRTFYGSGAFYRAAADKLAKTNRSGIVRVLQAISTSGVLSKVDALRLLAVSPDAQNRRRYNSEVAALKEIGIEVMHPDTSLECLYSPMHIVNNSVDINDLAARVAKTSRDAALFARVVVDQFRRSNLISWDRFDCASAQTPYITFNQYIFSAVGYSYLTPLQRWNHKSKPTSCPVLVDIFAKQAKTAHVESLLARIDHATNRRNSRMPCLGVMAALDFSDKAWAAARHHGLMTINLRLSFGRKALEAIDLAETIFSDLQGADVDTAADIHFPTFTDIFDDLKSNPVVVDLRSIAFEMITAMSLALYGFLGSLALGVKAPWQNSYRDADVVGFCSGSGELYIVECKAHHQGRSLDPNDVQRFFTQTVPAVKTLYRERGVHFEKCRAEIWTTGRKGREANSWLLESHSRSTDRWDILHRDRVIEQLPQAIRGRAKKLIESIAIRNEAQATDTTDRRSGRDTTTTAEQPSAAAIPF